MTPPAQRALNSLYRKEEPQLEEWSFGGKNGGRNRKFATGTREIGNKRTIIEKIPKAGSDVIATLHAMFNGAAIK
jgi:hypothetical protein